MQKRIFPLIVVLVLAAVVTALSPASAAYAQGGTRWIPIEGGDGPAPPALTLVEADGAHIDLAAHIPGVQATTVEADGATYVRLTGEGFGLGTETGLPDLPVLRRSVEIPFGAQVTLELVHVETDDYSLADLGLPYPVLPLQPSRPKSLSPQDDWPFVKDEGFYRSDAFYPTNVAAVTQEYVVRGHRAVVVEVHPLAYNPATGQLRIYHDIQLRLRLTGSDMARTAALARRYSSPVFDGILARQLLNYNQGRADLSNPDASIGYLIITADPYYGNMLPFVNLQQTRGFDVTIVRLSAIGSTNTAIKAYIQDAYDTWPVPPSYVLLVGDTDTMPGWDSVSAGEITDLYYATMDGSDDWVPDIGRGRFPVRSTTQADIMVNKAIAYAQRTGDEDWMKKIAFIATCDQYTVAEGTHNYVINTYTDPEGYTGIFPNNPQPGGDRLYCVTNNATDTDIQASINDERWAVIYSGHGGWTGWEMDYGTDDVQAISALGVFPFVASHACVTGDFDQTEVFGETWVLQDNKGALVFWGSSDSSYWDEDDVLERVAFDALFTTDPAPSVTGMTYAGLAAVQNSYPSRARYYWETYNILGDPSIHLFPELVIPNPGVLEGEVMREAGTNMLPISGARVTASGWPTRSFQTSSDDYGQYSFSLPEYTYTVTAQAYGFKTWITGNVQVMRNQTTTLDIVMTPADYYVVSGVVRDAVTGDPLWATLDISGEPFDPPTTHIETDPATGFYSLTLAEDVTYTLRADALLHLPTTTVVLPLTSDLALDFDLVPTTTNGGLVGWVQNRITGDPVPGATVAVAGTSFSDETDADGYFEILGLPPGVYTATASADLFSSETITGITIITGNLTQVTFRLPTAHLVFLPPDGVAVTLRLGKVVTSTLLISNGGEGALDFNLTETGMDFLTTTKTSGGPDSFGYTFQDGDEPDGPRFEWIDATDGTPLGLGDDGEVSVTLPFPFDFYGVQSTDLTVGNNGAVLFGVTSGDVGISNYDLSSATTDDIIAILWDDIDSDTGDVYYKTVGTAPARRFVIEWYDRPRYSNIGDATFEMIFYEGSNDIKFQYQDVVFGNSSYDYGASATVGIRGSGSNYLQYSYDSAALRDGLAICFQYPGSPPCDLRDIPWLDEDVVSGTVPGLSALPVTLTFDGGAITETGIYVGELTVHSNDPAAQPYVRYPVTMTVLPPLPELSIAKAPSADRVEVGTTLEYVITVTNTGGPATGLVISDTLPEQTLFAWADTGGVPSGTQVIWEGLAVPANGTLTVRYGVTVTCVPTDTPLVNDRYGVSAAEWPTVTYGSPVTVTAATDGVTATFDFPVPVVVNWPVEFDNLSRNGTAYEWDFGDGYTSTAVAPAHVYTRTGPYVVTLTAVNLCSSDSVTAALTVHDYALTVAPSGAVALSGDPGETVTYTLAVTNTGTFTTSVTLRLGTHAWPTTVSPGTVGPLGPGDGGTFQVRVTIPTSAAGNGNDVVPVEAVAADDPRTAPATATAYLTTTANAVYGMALSPVTDTRSTLPGETVTYTLHLVNEGNVADAFEIGSAGNVWPVGLPLTRTVLAAGESEDVPVAVTVPAEVMGGASDVVRVTVSAQGGGSGMAVLTTTATVVRGLTLAPSATTVTGDPDTVVVHTLHLTNTGNVSDTFALAVGGNGWTTTLSAATVGPLAPGAGWGLSVTVAIPFEAHGGDRDTAVVTATSQSGGGEAVATLTTQVAAQPVKFALRKTAQVAEAAPGDIVTYTLIITNSGHDHVPVVLVDSLPTRTLCLTQSVGGGLEFHDHPARLEFKGVLTAGHHIRFSYAAQVLSEATRAVTITNRVTATVGGEVYTAQAAIAVVGGGEEGRYGVYLPLVLRGR